jgi:hypothetical protein
MINIIDGLFMIAIIFLCLKSKVDMSKPKQHVGTDKYYRYRVWLTILAKNKKNN